MSLPCAENDILLRLSFASSLINTRQISNFPHMSVKDLVLERINKNKAIKQDEDNMEEILDKQAKRLQELNVATVLIKSKQNLKIELQKAREEVEQISYSIARTKKALKKIHEINSRSKELLTLVDTLDKRILHQEKNIPPELIQGYQKATLLSPNMLDCTVNSAQMPSSIRSIRTFEKQEIKDCKRTLFNEPEICPTISFITEEEFNKVPKYIIGRQTVNNLETINNFISAINQTLIAKYTILLSGKAAAQKKGVINLYLHYKKQEFDMKREENGSVYFFTAEDYHTQTRAKIDKTKLNLLTALRHCRRLRECRIRNELRYIITPY